MATAIQQQHHGCCAAINRICGITIHGWKQYQLQDMNFLESKLELSRLTRPSIKAITPIDC